MIHVTFDHLDRVPMDERISEAPQYGMERILGLDPAVPAAEASVKFRMYDDDGELMYSGTLDDDDEGENQSAALRWGEAMAGCTVIKIKRESGWEVEIG